MASGVKVDSACTTTYDELKMKHLHRYIIFKHSDDNTKIIVEKVVGKEATHADLEKDLLENFGKLCRYVAFDLDFKIGETPKNKIAFISWAPDTCTIKQKMLHTSSKEYLKKALQMVVEVQATDAEEISFENIVEKARKGMKD